MSWTSTRWVPAQGDRTPRTRDRVIRCEFCFERIPNARPGARVGDRGTRAFFDVRLQLYHCLRCQAAGVL